MSTFAKTFGVSLAILFVTWWLGVSLAKWGRRPALTARWLGLAVVALVGFVYVGSLHRPPVELLLVPALIYPLIASERNRSLPLRVLLLGELLAISIIEALDLAHWRYGIQVPAALWRALLFVMLMGLPGFAFWVRRRTTLV